jgi:O-antigen/teichoic acid export membrane protein
MVDAAGTKELGVSAVYRRLARNSAYLAGGTVLSSLFMMFAVVLAARALSPREFGLLVIFQSATWLVATLMSFSTQQPVIKLGASAQADGDKARIGRIIRLGLLIDAMAASLAMLAAFAFLAFGRDWVDLPDSQVGVAALFAASLLFTGYLTSNGIFRLLNRFGLLSLIQAGCGAAILAASVYLYATGAPFEGYCWAWAMYFVVSGQVPLLVGLYLARRSGIPILAGLGTMQREEISTFLSYCWTTWGTATAEALRSNGDSLLVGAAVSVEAAGIYNVAKQLAGVLRKMNTVYASAAFPEISALSAHGHDASAARVRRRMLLVGGLVGGSAIVAALLAGRPVLGLLFGEHFEAAYVPLVILTAAAASQLISHTLSMYVQVYISPERLFQVYMLAIAVFLIAVLPLTSAFGTTGTALSQLLFSFALIYFCHSALRVTHHAP